MCRFCCHAFEKCGNEFERKRVFFLSVLLENGPEDKGE